MSERLPEIVLARHGETAWSKSGQHTGLTDIPLTAHGDEAARRIGNRLKCRSWARVLTSPLQRARRTCELAGFTGEVDPDLVEWNYGEYEGLLSKEIRARRPGWVVFRDGAPGGESVAEVAARADRVIARLQSMDGDQLVFSSGHFLRALAARWLGLEVSAGRLLYLTTAALCVLGYDHNRDEPVIRLWNSTSAELDD
ncbi:MAG: histidine phosphatase family protein [Gemmataceae bacterium]|nr:histidine phosphatase family protein [Gemmataceae bacterium]